MDAFTRTLMQESQGFQSFYQQHRDRVLRFLKRRINDHQDAEDLAQETFLSASKAFDQPHVQPSLAWVLKIAENKLKNYFRTQSAQKRDIPYPTTFEEHLHATLDQERQHPESDLSVNRDLKKLHQVVQALPEPKRSCFAMYFFAGYTATEISKLLKIKQQTVKSHIHRARTQVIEYLS